MKKSILFFAVLAWVLSAVPAFADNADDVQNALNKAGFGVNEGSKNPEGSTTVVRDPNAQGGSRYSDQAGSNNSSSGSSGFSSYTSAYGKEWQISPSFKYHTYMTGLDATYKFRVEEDRSALPKPDNTQYQYVDIFNARSQQTVIGRPPSASDPIVKLPSEPSGLHYEFAGEKIKIPGSIYNYSGDEWGDCLGPNCIDRGAFRQPVGSWVHFTHTRIEERNSLSNLLGFPDTLQQISNAVGQPVVELRNGRE